MNAPRDVTLLLRAHQAGDPDALDRLVTLVYRELREMARRALAGTASHTLPPTAVVHEAWIRLSQRSGLGAENRAHFFGIAARAMRQVIVDEARRRQAHKRGGDRRRALVELDDLEGAQPLDTVLTIDETLTRLARIDDRLVRVAELRLFAGSTDEETAAALGIAVRTAQREWQRARAWLQRDLAVPERQGSGHGSGIA